MTRKPHIDDPNFNRNKNFDAFFTCCRMEKSLFDSNEDRLVIFVHDEHKRYKIKMKTMHDNIRLIHDTCKLQYRQWALPGRDPRTTSMLKKRIFSPGPNWSEFSKIYLSWSEPVLDVPKFSGPGFLKIFRFWSESVLDFSKFFVPGPVGSGPWIPGSRIIYDCGDDSSLDIQWSELLPSGNC